MRLENVVAIAYCASFGMWNLKERGISVDNVVDALTKPLSVGKIKVDSQGRPSRPYIGEKATAAVNPDNGNIVSTWPTGAKRAAKLKEALKKQ